MRDMRGHNEGTIIQKPDGKKHAVITLPDGRRKWKRACPHVHPASEKRKACPEARATLRALLAAEPAALEADRMTVGQYLSGWLDDTKDRFAPATWRKYEQHIRVHLAPALGHRHLSELSVGDVRGYLRAVRVDPQTARHHRATLRRALADAVREGLVGRNVAALAEPPPLPHRERPILTAAQVRTLIDGTRDDRLHALWVLLATTGLREAEALGLTWEDVDLDVEGRLRNEEQTTAHRPRAMVDVRSVAGNSDAAPGSRPEWLAGHGGYPKPASVHVRHTLHRIDGQWQLRAPKTPKSRRTVTLPEVAANALRAHFTAQKQEWLAAGRPGELGLVFVRPDGRPYHGSKLTTLLYPILERLGLPRVTCHDLRHTASTILFDAGVDLEDVAKMLGHTDSRMLRERYVHVRPERSDAVAKRMQEAVG